jgi:diacylglycerol kinase family enzyme
MIAASSRPSAVLIVNPYAGRLKPSEREHVVEALSARFHLEGFSTTARDAAIGIARDAADSGAELVIAFGGDGHVNEVANGLAGTGGALGIIPGGTMNVFSRALGLPLDPFEAVSRLHERIAAPARKVPLGRMDDRYFTFSAGCGFDAEAAERVERDLASKRRFGELFFYWSAFRVLASSYRHRSASMTVKGAFGEQPVAMAIACNSGPYAYLAGRSIHLAPQVRLDGELDLFALRKMRVEALPVYAWRCMVSGDLIHHRDAFYKSGLTDLEIVSDTPFHRHVDGEPLVPSTHARFSLERDVLNVKV